MKKRLKKIGAKMEKRHLKITKNGRLVAWQNIEGWTQEQIDQQIKMQKKFYGRECEIVTFDKK